MAFNFNLFQLLLLELKSIYKNLGLPPMCKVYVKIKLICCQYVAEREQWMVSDMLKYNPEQQMQTVQCDTFNSG